MSDIAHDVEIKVISFEDSFLVGHLVPQEMMASYCYDPLCPIPSTVNISDPVLATTKFNDFFLRAKTNWMNQSDVTTDFSAFMRYQPKYVLLVGRLCRE